MEYTRLSDFAKERGIHRDTISQYIRRNEKLFEGHIQTVDKWLEVDEIGIQLLSKKYPIPVEVYQENPHTQQKLLDTTLELAAERKKNNILLERLEQQALTIAQAESIQLLLDDTKDRLKVSEERLELSEKAKVELQLQVKEIEIRAAEERTKLLEQNRQLQEQLAAEQSKKWYQKLFK